MTLFYLKEWQPETRSSAKEIPRTPWIVYAGIVAIAIFLAAVLIRIGRSTAPPRPVLDFDGALETGFTSDGDPYRGSAGAPVVIELYEDFACPHCRDFFVNTEPMLEQNYLKSGEVKLVSHYVAIVNESSLPAAEAAACAADQSHFWEMRQMLFANQSAGVSRERVVEYGEIIGLDSSALGQCYDTRQHRLPIEQRNAAASRLGIRGTPTLILNGEHYEGALPFTSTQAEIPGLQALIEQQLGGS